MPSMILVLSKQNMSSQTSCSGPKILTKIILKYLPMAGLSLVTQDDQLSSLDCNTVFHATKPQVSNMHNKLGTAYDKVDCKKLWGHT